MQGKGLPKINHIEEHPKIKNGLSSTKACRRLISYGSSTAPSAQEVLYAGYAKSKARNAEHLGILKDVSRLTNKGLTGRRVYPRYQTTPQSLRSRARTRESILQRIA